MNILAAVWRVVVDLVVGDDPRIAVAVVLTLSVAAGTFLAGVAAAVVTVGGAVLVAVIFGVLLAVEIRRSVAGRGE